MKKTNKNWDKHPVQRGRKSGKQEKYIATSPRVESDECIHTQFLDEDHTLTHGWCLDCGHKFAYRNWSNVPGVPPLTDAELEAERDKFNEIWFGTPQSAKIMSVEELTAEVSRLSGILEQMKKEKK